MKKSRKIWLWLFRCIGILIILCTIVEFSNVLNGGSVTETRGMTYPGYWPLRELFGVEGVIECLFRFFVGIVFIVFPSFPKKENAKDASEADAAGYPYCRWWQDDEGKWYSEENPQMVKSYPEDGKCPLCHKKIEKIDVVLQG